MPPAEARDLCGDSRRTFTIIGQPRRPCVRVILASVAGADEVTLLEKRIKKWASPRESEAKTEFEGSDFERSRMEAS